MLKEYSGTVLFVSHDRYFVRKTATGILEFDGASVTQYNMGYDEYLEEKAKRTSAAAPVKSDAPAEKKAPVNNPGKIRSRLEHKLKKLEDALAESETRLAELKQELSDPALSSDYEKLLKIQGDIEAEETSQEDLLEQIMTCETELSEL